MKATTSRCLLPALSLWLFALPAAAEDSRVDELIERLEAQEQEIRTLREEVEDLREGVVTTRSIPSTGARTASSR
jgi:transposase